MGANFGVIMVAIKIVALVFIAILGLLTLIKDGPGPAFTTETFFKGTSTEPSTYAIALYSGLWAFDGWDQCNVSFITHLLGREQADDQFVAGEMRNPNKHLPMALHSSMSIVLLLFVLANCAYFIVLSPDIVASSNTVALDFGRVVIGKFGAVVFSTLVAISCFGALSNSFYTNKYFFLKLEAG
jgi:amino acid transporter